MMKYRNNKEGRQQVMEAISFLLKQGYTRHDVEGKSVILKKTLITGKVCSKFSIVEFNYMPLSSEIHREERTIIEGVTEVKKILFGWSSPSVEVANAVRAGLLTPDDETLIREEYSPEEWLEVQEV